MAKYEFLSEEWVQEAHRIRSDYHGRSPQVPVAVKMNLVVKAIPFGDGSLQAHLDTTGGEFILDVDHLENPDLTLTVDYDTARLILIEGDAQAAVTAFMGGRIRVDGDITKLLALQSAGLVGGADPLGSEIARRINAITA